MTTRSSQRENRLERRREQLIDRRERIVAQIDTLNLSLRQLDRQIDASRDQGAQLRTAS